MKSKTTLTDNTASRLKVYLFSYNRALFLENALQSIYHCASGVETTVIDDNSTDRETLKILACWESRIEVLAPKTDNNSHILGGLHNNMRYAFANARKLQKEWVLFIQDDMQLVREITEEDIRCADSFIEANSKSAQIQPCFLKSSLANLDRRHLGLDSTGCAYLRPNDFPGFSGFSDVGLFHVNRFNTLFGDLRSNEYDNNEHAQGKGIQFGISTRPFMMYLPFPVSHRAKKRTAALRLVELLSGSGFFPYDYMSAKRAGALMTRDPHEKPYAEQWLKARGLEHRKYWSYSGALSQLREGGGWRSLIGELLTSVRDIAK